MYSIIIPVYRNADFVPLLIEEFGRVAATIRERYNTDAEFIFVVDGSPDNSFAALANALPTAPFKSQLISHARNFGSFSAIRTGLRASRGSYCGVIAADLQEPPALLVEFLDKLVNADADIVIGVREGRDDPALTRLSANLFWGFYRRFIVREIPAGGVDVFACNRRIRDELLALQEAHSSLIGLIFWLGFRRMEVPYQRRARAHGKSGWTVGKKVNYVLDSIFAFTDLPIRILATAGAVGVALALIFAITAIVLRLAGAIEVAGYTATIVVITFFGALNMLGLGLVGAYAWRAYENTKQRPLALVRSFQSFEGSI